MSIIDNVENTIKKHNMLERGGTVICALSGGADSTALVCLLLELKARFGISIDAIHVNHGLRGDESERDENFVKDFCASRGVQLIVKRCNISEEAKKNNESTEEAGRRVRYEAFLTAAAKYNGVVTIATGHNENDVAETVLFNLARGAGLSGVCGIPPVRQVHFPNNTPPADITVIRPLIETPRSEIEAYLRQNNIPYTEDGTNAETDFTRNKIRHNVLPYLSSGVNTNAAGNISKFAALAREENAYLDSLAQEALCRCLISDDNNEIQISIERFNECPLVIKRRIARLCVKAVSRLNDVSRLHANSIIDLSLKPGNHKYHFRDLSVSKSFGALIFCKTEPETNDLPFSPKLDVPYYLAQIKTNIMLSRRKTKGARELYAPDIAAMQIRTRLPGDKIYFASINGHKRLKELFSEKKIPAHRRGSVPLLTVGGDVLWFRLNGADIFAQSPATAAFDYSIVYLSIDDGL